MKMEEIEEAVKISDVLREFNVCKDMRMEILRYYKNLKEKQKFLMIISVDPMRMLENEYFEILPYIPIRQVNLINMYKFLHEESSKFNGSVKITNYNENQIEITNSDGSVDIYKSDDLLASAIDNAGEIYDDYFPIHELFDRENASLYENVYILFRYVEL